MKIVIALAYAIFALTTANVYAQDAESGSASAEQATRPEPLALEPSWWQYFGNAGDKLKERLAHLREHLTKISTELPNDKSGQETRSTVTQLDDLLQRYERQKARASAVANAISAPRDVYTIHEYLDLANRHREAVQDVALSREEIERDTRSLNNLEQRISSAMGAYKELGVGTPDRLRSGLEIMRQRFLWAIGEEDVGERREALEPLALQAKALTGERDAAPKSLKVTSDDLNDWKERASTAEAARISTAKEIDMLRLNGVLFDLDASGAAKRKQYNQKLLELEARAQGFALDNRLSLTAASLAAFLLGELADTSGEPGQTLREARAALATLTAETEDRLSEWRRATDGERSSAAARMGDSDEELVRIHRARIEQADEASTTLLRLEQLRLLANALNTAISTRLIASEGRFSDWWERTLAYGASAFANTSTWGTYSLFTVNDSPVTAFGILRLTLILIAAWWLSRVVRHAIERFSRNRDSMNAAAVYTLTRVFHYVILVVGFLIALSSVGIDLTKFALVASAFGVGLGFGLQAIFSNFVAGLIILFERSLKIGDYVELESGVGGEVRGINIRSTMISTNDNVDILVPNSEFVNGRVTNWTLREAIRRVRIPFGVAYGTNKDEVRSAILSAAAEVPYTLNMPGREPQVWLVNFGESSLDFELVVWLTTEAVKRPATVNAAYTWAIETALGAANIEIPFPQRDVHVRSWTPAIRTAPGEA